MNLEYIRFPQPRRVEEYTGQAGDEVGGLALPPHVYDAIGRAKTSGKPTEFVVIGEFRGPGVRYLDFGTPTAFVEATTNYRHDHDQRRLRYVCPDCGRKDGQHSKVCGLA